MTMPRRNAPVNELMRAASTGDDDAFGILATKVQDDLFRFALAQGLRHADAAEACQETLLRAYRLRSSWRPDGNVKGWLLGIAMNVLRELWRRAGRTAALGLDPAMLTGASPGSAADDADRLGRLAEALAKLPDRQREAVSCRYLRRMGVRDTAAAMGCAEGTIKATVAAALANLREAMGANRR